MDTFIDSLLLARKNIFKMIKARGYSIDNILQNMTRERLLQMYSIFVENKANNWKNKSDIMDIFIENEGCSIRVIWIPDSYTDTICKNYINTLIEKKYDNNLGINDDIILILLDDKYLDTKYYHLENNNISIFSLVHLQFNLIEHTYIPKHKILSPDETKKILNSYKIKPNQLPSIIRYIDTENQDNEFIGDPVARYYGMRQDDIVEITRNSKTNGEHKVYRLVVGAPPLDLTYYE